jgi:uncharacterized protein HemY
MSNPGDPKRIVGVLRKFLLTRLLKSSIRKMRDDPSQQERLKSAGGSAEGIEMFSAYPDSMIDCLAESLAEAIVEDPNYYHEHNNVDPRRLNEIMSAKKAAWKWFNSDNTENTVTEEQMKRDGAALLCRKGRGHLESGRFSSARVFLEKACELDESSSEAWLALADALTGMGLIEEAKHARSRSASS